MDWEKYNLIPTEYATAREIGLAAATLGAMARRGFVEVLDGAPKKYRKINNPAIHIFRLCEENKDDYDTYFTLLKEGAPYGMLCSMHEGNVLDCYGNKYDLTNVIQIEFRTKKFNLKEI